MSPKKSRKIKKAKTHKKRNSNDIWTLYYNIKYSSSSLMLSFFLFFSVFNPPLLFLIFAHYGCSLHVFVNISIFGGGLFSRKVKQMRFTLFSSWLAQIAHGFKIKYDCFLLNYFFLFLLLLLNYWDQFLDFH